MRVLKSRRDFNYSSVWLPARPSVKTWTGVNYGDDVLAPYLAVYVAAWPASDMADCQRSLKYKSEGQDTCRRSFSLAILSASGQLRDEGF